MRQPTFGLWDVSLVLALERALMDGIRKIICWTDSIGCSSVHFPHDKNGCDPFFNVNTPYDLTVAQQVIL